MEGLALVRENRAFVVSYRANKKNEKACDIIAAVNKWVAHHTGGFVDDRQYRHRGNAPQSREASFRRERAVASHEVHGRVIGISNNAAVVGRINRNSRNSSKPPSNVRIAREKSSQVVVADINSDEALESAAGLTSLGVKAMGIKLDVSNSEEVKKAFEDIRKEFSRIDILVNNAGITRDGLVLRMKEEDWDSVMDINLKSVFLCSKEAIKGMSQQRYGRIVSLSSVAAFMGNPGQANYGASKAGIVGLTKDVVKGICKQRYNGECCCPRFHTNHNDGCTAGESEGGNPEANGFACRPEATDAERFRPAQGSARPVGPTEDAPDESRRAGHADLFYCRLWPSESMPLTSPNRENNAKCGNP